MKIGVAMTSNIQEKKVGLFKLENKGKTCLQLSPMFFPGPLLDEDRVG